MKHTDLLYGIVSGFNNQHFLLADIDSGSKEEILQLVGNVCIKRYHLGNCYIIRTGKGWHVVNFTDELTLRRYVSILRNMDCDPKYIHWVLKMHYGVLRVSRRSSHWNVPYLDSVVVSPFHKKEHEVKKATYFGLLGMEKNFKSVQRVKVLYDKKEDEGEFEDSDLSSMREEICRVQHGRSDKKGKSKSTKGMGEPLHHVHNNAGKRNV